MVQRPVENMQVSSVQTCVANIGFATKIHCNKELSQNSCNEREQYYPLAKRQLGKHSCGYAERSSCNSKQKKQQEKS